MYMPSEKKKKGKAHKFAPPFHGPYRVVELTANDAKVVPVNKPHSTPIFVALDRVCYCPDELPPGPLDVQFLSTLLTLLLTVPQMMRVWKASCRMPPKPKSGKDV